MRANHHEIECIIAKHGVVTRRDRKELNGTLDRLVREGRLVAVLPGTYADAGAASSFECRLAALRRAEPDAVLVGATAARLSFWPDVKVDQVECAFACRRPPRPGFDFCRRRIPVDLVVERDGVRLTAPALTALDLTATFGGEAIDQALRSRATTLKRMRKALEVTSGRRGNGSRRALLLDSRDEPWSEAERLCHRLLREAGIEGWKSNLPIRVDGATYYVDIAFEDRWLAIEIDGRLHEDDADLFESDRYRQNALVLEGWRVLRFTWQMLCDKPEKVIAAIRAALER